MSIKSKVSVVNGPLINNALSDMRKRETPSFEFRRKLSLITTFLVRQAADQLIMPSTGEIQLFDAKLGLVPVLRSGSGMVEAAQSLLPEGTPVYHLGIYREPSTLQATEYYSRLPLRPTVEYIFVLDPLLATGGTAIAAVKSMVSWGVKEENITLICILATSTGLSNFRGACPTANVVVATANDSLNALGRAVPGLGDVGDRLYGTTVE